MTATDTRPPAVDQPAAAKGSVLRSGALMAAGSVVSRATGFVRSAVVLAALGTAFLGGGGGAPPPPPPPPHQKKRVTLAPRRRQENKKKNTHR
ncbi:hypothetical protein ACFWJT_13220, partial [Streptomyces sp. NPDC127069]